MAARATCSGYGQVRMKNQPSIIEAGVPRARVSKKPEVFPRKIVRAMVENRKADNPKPEITIAVTVVLCKRGVSRGNRCGSGVGTDDLIGETFHDNIQRGTIARLATDPREELE